MVEKLNDKVASSKPGPSSLNNPIVFDFVVQVLNGVQLHPRAFPIILRGRHRKVCIDRPMAVGLGTKDLKTDW